MHGPVHIKNVYCPSWSFEIRWGLLFFVHACNFETFKSVTSVLYVLLTVRSCIIFFKWRQIGAHYFLVYLFQLLCMFRATVCLSSGELTVSMRHCYFSLCMGGYLVCWLGWDSFQPTDQTATDTVSSPDDGRIVARNMYRSWNKYTKK